MRDALILRGQTGNIGFAYIQDTSSTTGAGLTGVTSASGSLNISVRREKSSAMTTYTGANIGAISTLGTWANPGSGKVNIKAVDGTNAPGLYELHFEDAIYNAGDTSRKLIGLISGVTNMAPTPFEIPLSAVDPQSANAFVTGINSIAPPTGWNLPTYTGTPTIGGTGTLTITGAVVTQAGTLPITTTQMLLSSGTSAGQLDFTSGVVKSNLAQILGTALTETAGLIAAGFKKFFNVATPTGTLNDLPGVVPGAAGGLFIAGSNAATTYATLTVTGATTLATHALTFDGNGLPNVNFDAVNADVDAAAFLETFANDYSGSTGNWGTVLGDIVGFQANGVMLAASQPNYAPLKPTTAGRTLDVAATGEAGLDFDNIHDATGSHTLTNITVPTVTMAGSVTGNLGGNVVGTVNAANLSGSAPTAFFNNSPAGGGGGGSVTITYSTAAAASSTDVLPAGSINCVRGDTLSRQITGLGTLTGRSKLWVTVKAVASDLDSASKVQLEETGGLLYLNGATTTTTNGTVVVDDATLGNITITLKPAATAALAPGNYQYDVQWLTGAVVTTVPGGDFKVIADITRATN